MSSSSSHRHPLVSLRPCFGLSPKQVAVFENEKRYDPIFWSHPDRFLKEDPNHSNMTLFERECLRIQNDIRGNPQKYADILKRDYLNRFNDNECKVVFPQSAELRIFHEGRSVIVETIKFLEHAHQQQKTNSLLVPLHSSPLVSAAARLHGHVGGRCGFGDHFSPSCLEGEEVIDAIVRSAKWEDDTVDLDQKGQHVLVIPEAVTKLHPENPTFYQHRPRDRMKTLAIRKSATNTTTTTTASTFPSIAENLSFGSWSPFLVILGLVIDDGVLDRGHRRIIFNEDMRFCGVATFYHASYGTFTTFNYSDDSANEFELNEVQRKKFQHRLRRLQLSDFASHLKPHKLSVLLTCRSCGCQAFRGGGSDSFMKSFTRIDSATGKEIVFSECSECRKCRVCLKEITADQASFVPSEDIFDDDDEDEKQMNQRNNNKKKKKPVLLKLRHHHAACYEAILERTHNAWCCNCGCKILGSYTIYSQSSVDGIVKMMDKKKISKTSSERLRFDQQKRERKDKKLPFCSWCAIQVDKIADNISPQDAIKARIELIQKRSQQEYDSLINDEEQERSLITQFNKSCFEEKIINIERRQHAFHLAKKRARLLVESEEEKEDREKIMKEEEENLQRIVQYLHTQIRGTVSKLANNYENTIRSYDDSTDRCENNINNNNNNNNNKDKVVSKSSMLSSPPSSPSSLKTSKTLLTRGGSSTTTSGILTSNSNFSASSSKKSSQPSNSSKAASSPFGPSSSSSSSSRFSSYRDQKLSPTFKSTSSNFTSKPTTTTSKPSTKPSKPSITIAASPFLLELRTVEATFNTCFNALQRKEELERKKSLNLVALQLLNAQTLKKKISTINKKRVEMKIKHLVAQEEAMRDEMTLEYDGETLERLQQDEVNERVGLMILDYKNKNTKASQQHQQQQKHVDPFSSTL